MLLFYSGRTTFKYRMFLGTVNTSLIACFVRLLCIRMMCVVILKISFMSKEKIEYLDKQKKVLVSTVSDVKDVYPIYPNETNKNSLLGADLD